MRTLVLAALLAAAPWAVAQRMSARPAHLITPAPAATPPATIRSFQSRGPARSGPHTALFYPLGFDPFGIFSDSLYPESPPQVAPGPSSPALLLEALSALGAIQQPSQPASQPLLIELQQGRYVRLSGDASSPTGSVSVCGDPHVGTAEGGESHVGTAALGCPVERSSTPFWPKPGKLRHRPPTDQAANPLPDAAKAAPTRPRATSPSVTTPVSELLPITLLFRDGHREEVRDYTIADGVIYARGDFYSDGYWNKKIELSALDLPETVKSNQESGVRFVLPSAPNEVITRP
jgi:hypothetical protein